MSNQLGRFEILSELARSANGAVYKANDPETSQTVALKTLDLTKLGEQGPEMVKRVLEEGEASKTLNSHNLAVLYGAGDIGDQFCASLEYVQGNSIATMLARKEGFSIWDLQDIARQTCQGLDHAHTKGAFHYSLEPAKIMVTWDGTVKILGFGISTMGAFASQAPGPAAEVLHYMSPEQLHGDPLDARSNIFSLGAILYEMVTERKAFDGQEGDQVRQQILEANPVPPLHISGKMHPALNAVIMKALAKSPEERYQSGQELVNDLEKCKESPSKAAATPTAAAKAPQAPKAAPPVAAKPVAPIAAKPAPVAAKPAAPVMQKPPSEKTAWPAPTQAKAAAPGATTPVQAKAPAPAPVAPTPAPKKAFAAAAGAGANASASPSSLYPSFEVNAGVAPTAKSIAEEQPVQSAAVIEPESATEAPQIHVDPMMVEPAETPGIAARGFADIEELPPLKESYIAPPPTPPAGNESLAPSAAMMLRTAEPEKPKVQPREVAKKAVREIKKTPPKLFAYSIAAAVGVILLIVLGIAFHIRSQNADDDGASEQAAASQPVKPAAPAPAPAPATPAEATPTPTQQVDSAPPIEQTPSVSIKPKYSPRRKKEKVLPTPVVIPGQLSVTSTPPGAQLHFDGHTDPSWVTPYNLTGLAPGQHTVTISHPGFSSETRTIEVGSGSRSALVVQLAALTATLSVTSTPSGAEVFLDGKDTGHVTPAQIPVEKPGSHSISVRKQGFLEETTTANLQTGQTSHYAPTLRALGQTDEIKTVSKFKKVFGGGDTAGMGVVSIKTNPKGAQVAVNRRMVDKLTPLQFYLNPGNYVIDITASGYQDIHRVITVDQGGKVAIEESMQRE